MATQTTSTKNRLLTPDEAAEMLGVNRQTLAVWRTTKRYPIPYVKIGTSVRYRLSDLEKWIAERTVTPSKIDA